MTRLVTIGLGADADDVVASDRKIQGGAVSVGNFDGVHRGHQTLLRRLKTLADEVDGPAVAVTFDPHPAALLRPSSAPVPLTTMEERARRMDGVGVDALVVLKTDDALLRMSADEFYRRLFCQTLAAAAVIEGPNFYYGRDRAGDVRTLSDACERDGVRFEIAAATDDDNGMISSSRIRAALVDGDVAAAAAMMGTPHQITGVVVGGDRRGRTIGFPTANLAEVAVVVPAAGVYAAVATFDDRRRPAAVHIGPNPTFTGSDRNKIEVHVLNFTGDLYGTEMTVEFVRKIRGVRKFDSVEALIEQLRRDVRRVGETHRDY